MQFKNVPCWKWYADVAKSTVVRLPPQLISKKWPGCSFSREADTFTCRQVTGKEWMSERGFWLTRDLCHQAIKLTQYAYAATLICSIQHFLGSHLVTTFFIVLTWKLWFGDDRTQFRSLFSDLWYCTFFILCYYFYVKFGYLAGCVDKKKAFFISLWEAVIISSSHQMFYFFDVFLNPQSRW